MTLGLLAEERREGERSTGFSSAALQSLKGVETARGFAASNGITQFYWAIVILLLGALAFSARAAERMPPAPKSHFNDYAGVVSTTAAAELNKQLEQFERETSSQILVVVYPKMESDSSIEDYTVRVAQSWKVGQQGRDNGAVLFVFVQDRKMYLQVGYGLEGALPDALAFQIIEREIKPRFRSGDFDGGLRAGVAAILGATRGEYKALPPKSSAGRKRGSGWMLVVIVVIIILALQGPRRRRGLFGGGRRSGGWAFGPGGIWGGGGGGWGGGGGGFSGGGFSGGGGRFGGGGAGGSW